MDFYSNSTRDAGRFAVGDGENYGENYGENAAVNTGNAAVKPLTAEDVAAIVAGALASLRVYVVESDITSAQNSVRAVVEQATF